MKVIKPSFEVVSIQDPTKKIERVARTCYKSEDKIGEGTAEKMVNALMERNHEAMLEHASIVMAVDPTLYNLLKIWVDSIAEATGFLCYLRFSNLRTPIISGNIRAWRDFIRQVNAGRYSMPGALRDVLLSAKYKIYFERLFSGVIISTMDAGVREIDPSILSKDEREIHEDRTVLFTVDRGVSHEIVRHRPASYAQESTRYCNYNQGKYGGEITVIEPFFFGEETPEYLAWYMSCKVAEDTYTELIKLGRTPQEARSVLPNSLKTEIAMTTNLHEWTHFFNLRALGTTGAPHPQMREIAMPLLAAFADAIPEIFEEQHLATYT